jgi:outer membrane biosynthesis protein TonB
MSSTTTKRKITLKKLKPLNTIWHPESTLVFKSQKERLVIGRYVDEELVPLDETALELCEEWKFKHDESLVEAGTEEEGEEGEGESAEGEEEEAKEVSAEEEEDTKEVSTEEEAKEVSAEEEEASEPVIEVKKEEKKKPSSAKKEQVTVKNSNAVSALAVSDEVGAIVKNAIDTLNTQLSNLREQLSEKDENVQTLTVERDELIEKHTKLQAKFEGIKQLFT